MLSIGVPVDAFHAVTRRADHVVFAGIAWPGAGIGIVGFAEGGAEVSGGAGCVGW
jgi:hypothetical protein